ncbi:MAG: hypothetical protein K6F08_01715 [bacterium]|nr:hypothetical protein [bacterium]
MKNVALIFGGQSAEHEISIISAMQILNGFTKEEFNLIPLFLSRENELFIVEGKCQSGDFKNPKENKKLKPAEFKFGQPFLVYKQKIFKKNIKIDAAILATHGGVGEDGSLVALLKFCKIPVSAGNVCGQAVGYDKVISKLVLKSAKIPVIDCLFYYKNEWDNSPTKILDAIKKLRFPVIVKPARQGSSIGISVCKTIKDVVSAINLSLEFDNKFLVERAIENFSEFNCSVIGVSGNDPLVSEVSEAKKVHEILTFEDKYIGSNKKAPTKTKAPESIKLEHSSINPKVTSLIKKYSYEAFNLLNLSGVIRIDFIYDKSHKKLYLNEINTVPGSLAYYFWGDKIGDINYLVSKLVEIAETSYFNEVKINQDLITNIL